jgi:hypothetical protein
MTATMARWAALICATALGASAALAQSRTHADGGGYTYRSGSGRYTFMYRYDTGATYQRIGDFATYSDGSGTSGWSYYGLSGRHDSFSNWREGWSGSGYTPYGSSGFTTYRRTATRSDHGLGYYDPPDDLPASESGGSAWWLPAGLGGLGLGGIAVRRLGVSTA